MAHVHYEIKRSAKWMVLLVGVTLAFSLVTGCSHSEKTVRTETTATPAGQTTVVERETTVHEDHDRGVIGSVFHVVGEIIAFPFEVIASVFRFVF